jgi:hypothetical protein
MTETRPIANEPHQRAIDQGAAALLYLERPLAALAVATARQLAKDGGIEDWRLCLAEACAMVYRIAWRETHREG